MTQAVVMPVFNEAGTLTSVLESVRRHFDGTLVVVDDGSTDDTPAILAETSGVEVVTLRDNCGYGCALRAGFETVAEMGVTEFITMDCDGQHEPRHIPEFFMAIAQGGDIVSGSRYLPGSRSVGEAPTRRREINAMIAARVNAVTGWSLTDAFCGFKAYRTAALEGIELTEHGYAMPLELWAKAWRAGLSVREIPVERLYFDHDRSFGGDLDDPERRIAYYLRVWEHALEEAS